MKKVYISPVIEQEKFETADIITASMTFRLENYAADNNQTGGMPEVNVKERHFQGN